MLKIREIFSLTAYILSSLAGLTLIKMGAQGEGRVILHIMGFPLTPKLIVGVVCYAASFLMYTVVISQMQISLVMPVLAAFNSIGIVMIGLWIFHEKLTIGQTVGIMVVIIGALIIGIFSK